MAGSSPACVGSFGRLRVHAPLPIPPPQRKPAARCSRVHWRFLVFLKKNGTFSLLRDRIPFFQRKTINRNTYTSRRKKNVCLPAYPGKKMVCLSAYKGKWLVCLSAYLTTPFGLVFVGLLWAWASPRAQPTPCAALMVSAGRYGGSAAPYAPLFRRWRLSPPPSPGHRRLFHVLSYSQAPTTTATI